MKSELGNQITVQIAGATYYCGSFQEAMDSLKWTLLRERALQLLEDETINMLKTILNCK